LNRAAAEAMRSLGAAVHAATDVTGFGLLGHLRNIARASGIGAIVSMAQVPVIPAAWRYVRDGIAPGGTHANRRFLLGLPALGGPVAADEAWVDMGGLDEPSQLVLCDAQTSGGLLIAVDPERAGELLAALAERGAEGHRIGRLDASVAPGHISISD